MSMNWNVRRMWMKCDWLWLWGWRCWSGSVHGFDSDDLAEIELTKVSIIASGRILKCYWLLFGVTGCYWLWITPTVKTGFDQGLTFEVQDTGMSMGLEWRWNGVGIDLEVTWRWLVLLIKSSWPGFKNFKLMRSWPGLQKFQVDQDLKNQKVKLTRSLKKSSWPRLQKFYSNKSNLAVDNYFNKSIMIIKKRKYKTQVDQGFKKERRTIWDSNIPTSYR